MTPVKVVLGFWKNCEGVVAGKVPLLPIYKVLVAYSNDQLDERSGHYLLVELPKMHWFFRWQFVTTWKPPVYPAINVANEAIKYLVKHCSVALNMSDPKVVEAMGGKKQNTESEEQE
jgi:hypothetical protein